MTNKRLNELDTKVTNILIVAFAVGVVAVIVGLLATGKGRRSSLGKKIIKELKGEK